MLKMTKLLIWSMLPALGSAAAGSASRVALIRPTNDKNSGSWRLTLDEQFDNDLNPSLWTKGWSWYDGHNHSRPRVHTKASDTCWYDDQNVSVRMMIRTQCSHRMISARFSCAMASSPS